MTVDTGVASENKTSNPSITKRDRRDVIRQIHEITGADEQSINQTIEACKDNTGRYSLEHVINLLVDDNARTNLQASSNSNTSAQPIAAAAAALTCDRNATDTITDDVIEMTHEIDNQSTVDEDLERALQLSRETMEQSIDESEITRRESLNEPIGLKNIGNTCWFNSIVQTLYTLPFFRELILNFQLIAINRPLTANEQQAIGFIEELRNLFILMLRSPRRSINPDRAIKKFKHTRKLSGIDFSHEDCSEFALHLIDLIELAFETMGKNNSTSFSNPINNLVTGEVIVERSGNNSIREPLRQIDIQMNDANNLYDGLETLWLGSSDEDLSNQQNINEQRWLTRLPPVLFICLNRYRFSQTTKQTSKILASFEFYSDLYLDRFMLTQKNLILNKRQQARTLYNQLHELEDTLNSYLKYPCNNESISLANAIRVVYEYATGCRLNPTITKKPNETISNRSQQQILHPSHISDEDLHIIQNTLPTWLTDIETKCSNIREQIQNLKNELKQLYDEPQLKQNHYSLHAVCVHEGSATVGHFWTYVFHPDRQQWYRYNDNEVTESKWEDVFQAGIGDSQSEEQRVPSAYLLVYINNEQRSLSNNIHYELTDELQRILKEDLTLLEQQIETVKLDELCQNLQTISHCVEKTSTKNKICQLTCFHGTNAFFDSDVVRPISESTINSLKAYETRLLSSDLSRLLDEIITKEIKNYHTIASTISSSPSHQDIRLQHILVYCSANQIPIIYQQRIMFDVIRFLPISNDDTRLKIFQLQAEIIAHEVTMSNEQIQEYHRILNDYRDYRSVIAAFIAGYQLFHDNRFDEAMTYLCVACEYNLRLSKQYTTPMKAMDKNLLHRTRRLCFEKWNEAILNRFKTESNYRLDVMIRQFLPCLLQLKLSFDEDKVYINEIQRIWCSLINKVEGKEQLNFLEEFLQHLHEPPYQQHCHSVSINKHQLIERYEEIVRDIYQRYPTNFIRRTNPLASIQIPVVIHQAQRIDRRGTSPMQQSDDEHESQRHRSTQK